VVVELRGVERKLAEGLSWCGEGWGELPTTASGSPEWRKGRGGGFWGSGVRGKGKGGEWVEYYLLVLLDRRGREEEQARARDTAGGEVAAGRSSGGHGARGRGQQRREAGPGKGEGDAWSPPEQEVAPGRS
jgi:hypothetical protein